MRTRRNRGTPSCYCCPATAGSKNLNGPDSTSFSSMFLSTATLPARDRLPVWREVFGQTMVRLDIEPVKGTSFYAEGELCVLPGAAVASVTAAPVRVSRTHRQIGRASWRERGWTYG